MRMVKNATHPTTPPPHSGTPYSNFLDVYLALVRSAALTAMATGKLEEYERMAHHMRNLLNARNVEELDIYYKALARLLVWDSSPTIAVTPLPTDSRPDTMN